MQFQIPQFIEVEDKIFGPLTFKQFIYVAGGAGLAYILWRLLPSFLAVLVIIPTAGLAFALAFYKINDQPFIKVLESGFKFITKRKLYLWKKKEKAPDKTRSKEDEKPASDIFVPRLSESKLKDLTWTLDVHESLYSQERPEERKRQ